MTKPATADHKAAPTQPRNWSDSQFARIKTETREGTGSVAGCSCGWESRVRKRRKVAEDAAEAHVTKRHGGRALWL